MTRMKKVTWIAGLLMVTTALPGLSCRNDNAGKKDTAEMPPGHEKVIEQHMKGIEESKVVVVAKVNGVNISMHELIAVMNQLAPKYIKPEERNPQMDEKVKNEALDALIFRELAVQEAERQGLKVPPEMIDSEVNNAKAGLGSEDAYRQYLKDLGLTETLFRKGIEKAKLFEMIALKEISQKVKVDEKAVRDTYNRDKKTYTQKDPPRMMTFEEAKGVIERRLAAPVAEKRKAEWEAQLKKSAKIEIILGVAIK